MTGYGIIQCYENYYDISYGRKGIYSGLTLLHYGISFAAIVVVIVLYQRMQESHRQNLEKHMLQLQIEDMQKHISQVESLYGDIRALKHDMANHVMTLEALYAENEMQQAQSYAKHLKTALKDAVSEIKSGNPVTDVILAEYRKRAKQCGIRFENHFFYPENGALDVFDVSIILNNALDNALEEAQTYALSGKNAEVNICSYQENHAYMIEVSNSFAGKLRFDAAGDLPQTQKKDAGSHGFGLANIRRIAW